MSFRKRKWAGTVKDVAPKDLRKTFSWYKWHFSSWTVECCSCRAAEQPTLVVPGLRGPGTVHLIEPRLETEAVGASSAKGIQSRGKPRLTHPLKECQKLLLRQKNGCALIHFATLGPLTLENCRSFYKQEDRQAS